MDNLTLVCSKLNLFTLVFIFWQLVNLDVLDIDLTAVNLY